MILPFIDASKGFIYKDFWWYDHFAHHDLKLFQVLILIMIFVAVIGTKKNVKYLTIKYAQQYTALLCFMLLSILIITIFKRNSVHSCPWYILDLRVHGITFSPQRGQGGCFPGGHASLGYAWLAGFFVFYQNERSRAYFYLISALILGTAMGYTQMMRGAHFLSHNLWTMWITYFIDFILYIFLSHGLFRLKRDANRHMQS